MRVLAKPAFRAKEKNPYTWSLNQKMVEMGVEIDEFSLKQCFKKKYDVFHLHWPEWHLGNSNIINAIAKTALLLLSIAYLRLRGSKIIWTAHNLATHQKLYPWLEKWFWRIFTHQLAGFISLTDTGTKAAREVFPALRNIPGFVIPHNHYRQVYPRNITATAARTKLGIAPDRKVILFFGRILPYKNVPLLIETFKQMAEPNTVLYVVGSFSPNFPDLEAEVKRKAAGSSQVKLYGEFVPQAAVQLYFQAADLVIFPFSEILNSGSAILSLSFDRPIAVPAIGSLGELQRQVGREWVFTYTDKFTPMKMKQALDWAANTPRSPTAPIDNFDLQTIAQKTISAYQDICSRGVKAEGK